MDLAGQVVVITGAAGSIGSAYARAFARRGAHLVLNDLEPGLPVVGTGTQSLTALCAELDEGGYPAIACHADVADPASASRIVATAMEAFGRLDVLVNNAGIMRNSSFAKMTDGQFQQVMDIHVRAVVNLTREAMKIMITRQYGRIVMTTSAAGMYGAFGVANYAAAKMAQIGLMNVLAIEGARKNVHTNAIAPIADSPMFKGMVEAGDASRLDTKWIVPAALYLSSPQCDRSGRILVCGGGHYAFARMVESKGRYFASGRLPGADDFNDLAAQSEEAFGSLAIKDAHGAISKALG